MYVVRRYNRNDYRLLLDWSEQHGVTPYPIDALSEFGFIVEYKGEPIVYTSIYLGIGTTTCLYGSTLSNKKCKNIDKYFAVKWGMNACIKLAKDLGYVYLNYFTDTYSIANMLINRGATLHTETPGYYALTLSLDESDNSFMR